MAQEQRPIEEVLFGAAGDDAVGTDADLAEAISAWFRASRARLRGVRRQPPTDAGEDHRVEEED